MLFPALPMMEPAAAFVTRILTYNLAEAVVGSNDCAAMTKDELS